MPSPDELDSELEDEALLDAGGWLRERVRGAEAPPSWLLSGLETVLAVGAATVVVALMQSLAPPAGLGVIYLLAVLEVAARRGQLPALVAALLGVLTLNYFFVTPRHELTIARTSDLAELLVFLIVAIVVGRLASTERLRAAEAESRAREAAAREQEAKLLADAAEAVLSGSDLHAQLSGIESMVATATGAKWARLTADPVAMPRPHELAIGLRGRSAMWLYLSDDLGWEPEQLARLPEPLGKLIDVARAREQAAESAAEIEAARRAETARTAVLHAISHDLRSPLTAINTAASALGGGGVSAAERTELFDVIDHEGRRLAKLVDDLLDLSKIEAGAVRPQADWCDLGDVLGSAASGLEQAAHVEFGLPEDLPLVRADAAQLERVFSNLLQNAVKFSPTGAPVRVTAGTGGGRVTVRVTDQGEGIPLSQRTHVFEPFFRGRSGSGAGSGLGLAICRGFVEANGGQIALQADTGEGTSFAVSFPSVPQPDAVEPSRS